MFVSIIELSIEQTDYSTYFSITPIDTMNRPEETMRFDKHTIFEYGKWIQARFFDKKSLFVIIIYIVYSVTRRYNFLSRKVCEGSNHVTAHACNFGSPTFIFLVHLNKSILTVRFGPKLRIRRV